MPPGRRIVLLILLFVAGSCVTGVLASIITHLGGNERLLATTRISAFGRPPPQIVAITARRCDIGCRDTSDEYDNNLEQRSAPTRKHGAA